MIITCGAIEANLVVVYDRCELVISFELLFVQRSKASTRILAKVSTPQCDLLRSAALILARILLRT